MNDPAPPAIDLVDDPDRLAVALGAIDQGVVGVDVERADSHRYYRSAALIQVGVPGRCVLVDSHRLEDLGALDGFLRGRLSVLHAIENDLVPLDSAGVHLDRVADTAVAASLLGLPIGLGPLLAEVLEIEVSPDKDKYQRADWEARPLTDGMAAYAAGDVVDLPVLWRELARRLRDTGRYEWYEQELAHTIQRTREDTRSWDNTKGAGRLSPPQRTVLRHLWERREQLAQEHDIAPQRLVRDEALLDLAQNPPGDVGELVKRAGRRRARLRPYADAMLEAIEAGLADDPDDRPSPRRHWADEDRAAYDAMRRARAGLAEELDLDPGVLCPSRPLTAVVAGDPATPEELCALAELRPWQTELLADVLWQAYTGAYEDRDAEAS